MELNGPATWTNTSGHFLARPSVLMSGLGLRAENIIITDAATVSTSTGIVYLDLSHENLVAGTWGVPVMRRMNLHPKFTITSAHLHGSLLASGWFRWNTANNTPTFTHGTWLANGQPAAVVYDIHDGEIADQWKMSIDNDGSGTAINTVLIRVQFGFTIDPGL
jgi:hypothetical protein